MTISKLLGATMVAGALAGGSAVGIAVASSPATANTAAGTAPSGSGAASEQGAPGDVAVSGQTSTPSASTNKAPPAHKPTTPSKDPCPHGGAGRSGTSGSGSAGSPGTGPESGSYSGANPPGVTYQ